MTVDRYSANTIFTLTYRSYTILIGNKKIDYSRHFTQFRIITTSRKMPLIGRKFENLPIYLN